MKIFFLLLTTLCSFLTVCGQSPKERLKASLEELLKTQKVQAGIALIIDGEDTLVLHNEVHYPMMSVFKFHQALAVADCLQRQGISLDTTLCIRKEELKENTYSPLRDRYPEGNVVLSVADLLTYTLQWSDNNACDILFDRIIGTKETEAYIRSLGIEDFRITANEDDMHREWKLCYENWSTPLAAARLLELFITEKTVTGPYYTFIRRTMTGCTTGKDRLPAAITDSRTIIGHKTGTGDRNPQGELIGINDIGFIFPAEGPRYTLAVFLKDSKESDTDTAALIGKISKVVLEYVTQQN